MEQCPHCVSRELRDALKIRRQQLKQTKLAKLLYLALQLRFAAAAVADQ